MFKSFCLTFAAMTIWIVALGSWCGADEPQANDALSNEEKKSELTKLREIFASVEKLPAKDSKWVEIEVGAAKSKEWVKGWRLKESDVEIQLLRADGGRETYNKKKLAGKKPEAEFEWSDVWAVRNEDFGKYCRDFMTTKKPIDENKNELEMYRFQRERAEADNVVLNAAYLAATASFTDNELLAIELLSYAVRKHQEVHSRYTGTTEVKKLHEFVADHTYPLSPRSPATPQDMLNQNPGKARIRSLESKLALAKIPYRSDHDAILRGIKQLESLIAEDKTWKEPTKEEFAKLITKQKAAYWLHHLRDLQVTQGMSPGMCRVLGEWPWLDGDAQDPSKKDTPNPAIELKNLGYEVVPQIIAHLDDGRPTRCIGYWREYLPDSYYTLCYGDCCQQIFEAIALHTIYKRTSTNGYPLRDGQGQQCKKLAEKWWEEFQKKGEKQMLIDATMRGNHDSPRNADRLVKKFSEVAFEPLRDGIRTAKEGWIQSNMLNHVRALKDDRVVAFLHEQAKGTHLYVRVNALEGLFEREQEDALTMLIAEWRSLEPDLDDRSIFDGQERLQTAMASCGKEEAILALADRWKKIPLDWRHRSLVTLRDVDKDFANKPFTRSAHQAVDKLLISCLSDRQEGRERRRTCDLAAVALATRWGDPKLFDLSNPLSVRNRKILEIENIWRAKQGLKTLPMPAPLKIPPISESTLTPLLKALIGSTTTQAQVDASAAVERLGLGAIPGVRKELTSLAKTSPASCPLSKLANRLACIVREVHFSDDSVARPDAMRKAAERLKDQPLTEKTFIELITAIHKLVPSESGGIAIALDREGDDTGIQLEIRVLPRRDPAEGKAIHLRRLEEVIIDGQKPLVSGCMTVGVGQETETEWDPSEWKQLASALQSALSSPPETQFQVRVTITRGR